MPTAETMGTKSLLSHLQELRTFKHVTKENSNQLPTFVDITREAFGVVHSLLSGGVGVEVGAHVLYLQFQIGLRSLACALMPAKTMVQIFGCILFSRYRKGSSFFFIEVQQFGEAIEKVNVDICRELQTYLECHVLKKVGGAIGFVRLEPAACIYP